MSLDQRVKALLERQAAWQRGRASLSWEEKIRQAVIMREAQRSLRGNVIDPSPVQGEGQPPGKKPPR
ncbi:MAG: hypothetical protein IMZ55_13440 [Acidobacteria bacterium]|nr:hypothetical protein [Acidobacteriota bacterium]